MITSLRNKLVTRDRPRQGGSRSPILARRAKPCVEALEERVVLAVVAPVDAVLNGISPAVAGSNGSLRIRLSGTSAQVQWGSTDSYLGIMDTSLLTPTSESVTTGPGGVPNHLVFIATRTA